MHEVIRIGMPGQTGQTRAAGKSFQRVKSSVNPAHFAFVSYSQMSKILGFPLIIHAINQGELRNENKPNMTPNAELGRIQNFIHR